MTVPKNYDDEVGRLNMHPDLLPTPKKSNPISTSNGTVLDKVFAIFTGTTKRKPQRLRKYTVRPNGKMPVRAYQR